MLFLLQVNELHNDSVVVKVLLGLGWVGFLTLFFVVAPWYLTHQQLSTRDLLPGGILTALALVVLMVVSNYVMQFWVDLYARDYGGFGVVLALYFWLALSSAVIVWAAALSPALAARRRVRAERAST
jgi:uncharacterized BrkB/YihY/UPF0761 family membrane protein